jgi:YidC/Oxa1 family membrane protein insertase
MNEQQRVILAVALCLGIALAWNWSMSRMAPEPLPEPETSAAATPEPAAPSPAAAPGEPAPAQPVAPRESRPFATALFVGELGNDAALHALTLRDYTEQPTPEQPEQAVSLVTAKIDGAPAQALVSPTGASGAWAFAGGQTLENKSESGVVRRLEIVPRPDAYALDYRLVVTNGSSSPVASGLSVTLALAPHPGSSQGGFLQPPADLVSGLCAADESIHRKHATDLEQPLELGNAAWVGLDRQYFVVALVPGGNAVGTCRMRGEDHSVFVDFTWGAGEVAPGASRESRFVVYLGPKRARELSAVAPELSEVIDYNILKIPMGFIARPMVFLLNLFHGWTASWGVAIILLTLLVKTLLFPVTYKSVASMRRMQLLKPELDKLKERFGTDKERMQMEQLKLFRERGVNPVGGCLPMLLQMPIWFALYRTLWTSVDLYQQSFLWLDDLTAREHFPFLSIAFGGLTVLQQRLQPMSIDSQQTKVMLYVMPVMFAVFMIPLPSGLVLYIVVNSILTIVQQLVINRRLKQA